MSRTHDLPGNFPAFASPTTWPHRLRAIIETVCFWIAVIIPFGYLPVLALAHFIPMSTGVFIALIVLNFITLVIGHGYSPSYL